MCGCMSLSLPYDIKSSPTPDPHLTHIHTHTHTPAIVAALTAFFLILAISRKPRKDAPPVIGGNWPVFGHFFLFLQSPINLITNSYRDYGSVFTVNLFTQKMTFLIGPAASSAFFKATDKELGQGMCVCVCVCICVCL